MQADRGEEEKHQSLAVKPGDRIKVGSSLLEKAPSTSFRAKTLDEIASFSGGRRLHFAQDGLETTAEEAL